MRLLVRYIRYAASATISTCLISCALHRIEPEAPTIVAHVALERPSASRLFASSGRYVATEFAAYGIVAFQSLPTPEDTDRYRSICEGFISTIPPSHDLESRGITVPAQLVTVWPLNNETVANSLNSRTGLDLCEDAISHIDLYRSTAAITTVERQTDRELRDHGPYLLAWSPARNFYEDRSRVLIVDLSHVSSSAQAVRVFRYWVREVQENPDRWSRWDEERIRMWIEQHASFIYPAILHLFNPL